MDRKFTKNIITRGKIPFNTITRSSKSFLPNCQTFARTPLEILHTHTHTHTGARVTKQHPSPPWPPQITNHQSHARSINHWPNTWRTRSVNYQPGRSASQSAPSNHRNWVILPSRPWIFIHVGEKTGFSRRVGARHRAIVTVPRSLHLVSTISAPPIFSLFLSLFVCSAFR